jgi:hypothetical protein
MRDHRYENKIRKPIIQNWDRPAAPSADMDEHPAATVAREKPVEHRG